MKSKIFVILFLFIGISSAYSQSSPGYQSHNFQYLTGVLTSSQPITSIVANAWNSSFPPKYYSMAVTTAASGFLVNLEGSLDNANWTVISVTNSALGITSNQNFQPMLYFRLRAASIGANTSVTATAIGVP